MGADQRSDGQNVRGSQLRRANALALNVRPVSKRIATIALWGIPSKIPEAIVGPVTIVVTTIGAYRPRPNKRGKNKVMHERAAISTKHNARVSVLSGRGFKQPAFVASRDKPPWAALDDKPSINGADITVSTDLVVAGSAWDVGPAFGQNV